MAGAERPQIRANIQQSRVYEIALRSLDGRAITDAYWMLTEMMNTYPQELGDQGGREILEGVREIFNEIRNREAAAEEVNNARRTEQSAAE